MNPHERQILLDIAELALAASKLSTDTLQMVARRCALLEKIAARRASLPSPHVLDQLDALVVEASAEFAPMDEILQTAAAQMTSVREQLKADVQKWRLSWPES